MLRIEMHPSNTISFEPGLERGAPWGRDLITFMTSAAGYMMRTLQKPRKNKPSKRQVNHRRFLHNMIQRKFAEIEAANHQSSSAIFAVDTESRKQSEAKWTDRQESVKNWRKGSSVFDEVDTKPRDDDSDTSALDSLVCKPNESSFTKISVNKLNSEKVNQIRDDGEQVGHLSKNLPQEISEKEQFQCASSDLRDLTPTTSIIRENSTCPSLDSNERITENSHQQNHDLPHGQQQQQYSGLAWFDSLPTSPISPLSLNSCDFEVQTEPDCNHNFQIQHTAESLQKDSMENLELLDLEEYLQQIGQMDLPAWKWTVWDIHHEQDMNCFQDSIPFPNTSHAHFSMDTQVFCNDGDCQIAPQLENTATDMHGEDELRSNKSYSLTHCRSSDDHNHARQTTATVDCSINQTELSSALNKEHRNSTRGTQTACELASITSHAFQEPKHDSLDKTQHKNWEQQLSYYSNVLSVTKNAYYSPTDKERAESEPTQNPNLDHSNPVNSLFSAAHGYSFDIPEANCNSRTAFANITGNQSIQSFEGIAQSFTAPYQNIYPHPVSTPPLNDDWLFSNILTEVDFDSFVSSHRHTYY